MYLLHVSMVLPRKSWYSGLRHEAHQKHLDVNKIKHDLPYALKHSQYVRTTLVRSGFKYPDKIQWFGQDYTFEELRKTGHGPILDDIIKQQKTHAENVKQHKTSDDTGNNVLHNILILIYIIELQEYYDSEDDEPGPSTSNERYSTPTPRTRSGTAYNTNKGTPKKPTPDKTKYKKGGSPEKTVPPSKNSNAERTGLLPGTSGTTNQANPIAGNINLYCVIQPHLV